LEIVCNNQTISQTTYRNMRVYVPFYALILFVVFSLFSCKTTNLFHDRKAENKVEALDSVFHPNKDYTYKIRLDDKITIGLWNHDEWSVGSTYGIYNSNEVYGKWLMVDVNGYIEVPKIGPLYVKDLTLQTLKDTLRKRFSHYVLQPILDVKVLNREITVLGEVKDPQVITIDKERNTLLEVIARCKGLEFYANAKYVKVFRQNGENVHIATIDLTKKGDYFYKNINLIPGDIVIIPSKKYKEFDRRISTIIPFTTTVTAAAIFMSAF
jgi:polysaccharide export outer membrane protein